MKQKWRREDSGDYVLHAYAGARAYLYYSLISKNHPPWSGWAWRGDSKIRIYAHTLKMAKLRAENFLYGKDRTRP